MSLRTRHLALAGTILVLAIGTLVATVPEIAAVPLASRVGWVLGIGLVGLFCLWTGGRLVQRGLSGIVGELTDRVRRMSAGDFGASPSRAETHPDLAELAAAVHDTAEQIEDRLGELERQRDELQAIMDSTAEGVIALTDDARVLRMNPAAAELLDVSQPPVLAPVGTLIRHPELRDHLEESVIFQLPPLEVQLGERYLRISSHLMKGGGSVVTFLDVTRLRQMEQVRRDFVANASHELKTPLTAVRGFAEALLEEEPSEGLRQEFLGSIRKNTIRLQNLVDDLLDLSRLESGGWDLRGEEVELASSALEVWEGLAPEQHPEKVRFRIEGDGVALADHQALHQIFRNLYDNALRYTQDGGTVTVTIAPNGPTVRVAVTDSGTGITSAALPRIFERFYRVDSGRDRDAGGTGLGLAIVRHLVQSMNGVVGAESELGRGTTIYFMLPKATDEQER